VIRENSKPLTIEKFRQAVDQGALILDTRKADEFEKGFIPGSINIGLNGQFAVWVGTLIDIQKKLVLVTEPGRESETVLRLARVGYEKIAGYLQGGVSSYDNELEKVRSIPADEIKRMREHGAVVLDVRKPGEWSVSHIKDAEFLPLANFPENLSGLNKDQKYVVHCGGGYRSMTAISIMKKFGFKDLANIQGGFGAMQKAGLQIVTEEIEV